MRAQCGVQYVCIYLCVYTPQLSDMCVSLCHLADTHFMGFPSSCHLNAILYNILKVTLWGCVRCVIESPFVFYFIKSLITGHQKSAIAKLEVILLHNHHLIRGANQLLFYKAVAH